jgi:cell division protein FtsQ
MYSDSTGNLTLIPREGQEKFLFGQPEEIEKKLRRLEMYYGYIVPEKGEKTYRSVDLRYNDQIICK